MKRTLKQKIDYATKVMQCVADEYNRNECKRLETIKELQEELRGVENV